MKPVYQFRAGSHVTGDAQAVGERLEQIRAKRDGLTPAAVLTDARNIRSALHTFFEWDDEKAAEAHRLQQAGHLIRCVQVQYVDAPAQQERQIAIEAVLPAEPQPRTVRAFVAIKQEGGGNVYESTERAMADKDMRRQVIERAHSELDSVSRKYRELTELGEVFSAIDRVGALVSSKGLDTV